MKKIRIGSGSAFWGDMLDPAVELAKKGEVDYIGFDHLAELTLAIMQRMRAKDPSKGYIQDIIPWMKAILPIASKKGTKLITNAGGANPEGAAEEVVKIAKDLGLSGMKFGVVTGDDIFPRLDEIRSKGWKFKNFDTGEENIDRIKDRIVAANAYIGADEIIGCLTEGADVVITGRVSDNALYVGPLMHEFGWDYGEPYWDRIGAAVTVGHIIECAACVTGGMSNMWKVSKDPHRIGFPIAEFSENGEAVITKTEGSGGIVNQWTVKEHLVYEILDPSNYYMPDGVADFTSLNLEEIGKDQVRVTGMSGKPRPKELKVCIGYQDGFIGEGHIFFPWPDALAKAQWAEKLVRERFKMFGLQAEELRIDLIGVNVLHGELAPLPDYDLNEVGLRIVAKTKTREEADMVRRAATHLWTAGPVGASFGVPFSPRPVISLWPTLVPREEVRPQYFIKEVK
jgi:hypothetical protein